jgi:hypothetical protein
MILIKRKNKNNFGKIIFPVGIMFFLIAASAFSSAQFQETSTNILLTPKLSYEIQFQEPTTTLQSTETNTYANVNMKGCVSTGNYPGAPTLPKKVVQLALPLNTQLEDIQVTGIPIEYASPYNLEITPIFPYQASQPFGYESNQPFEIDQTIYSTNTNYPTQILHDYTLGYSRGYQIIGLTINPIQYNPVSAKLNYYPKITIDLKINENPTPHPFYRNNQEDKQWVQSIVSNPKILDENLPNPPQVLDYPGGLCDPGDNYDYVIITTTYNGLDYWDTSSTTPYNWEDLMEKHETENGYDCTLVTIQDITACTDYHDSDPLFNDLECHIREFCRDAYQDWGTQYVFVGGDDEWIPARELDSNYEKNMDSDLYWSNLDSTFNEDHDYDWGEPGDGGFDLYAELFIGRITCDTPQDVSNWMTKSFYYQDSSDIEYLDNTGFYGGNTGWQCQGDDFMDFSAVLGTDDWLGPDPHHDGPWPSWLGFLYGFETWKLINPSVPFDMDVLWTAEPPNPGWQGGSESTAINGFRNAISNDEVTIISGIAHANAHMSLDVGSSSWESNYHNTKPFFIHDYGCHCGDMDAADDGVLHSMLFHSDTELAFGATYNTGYGWGNLYCTNSSSALQAKLFWDYFLDVTNNSQSTNDWQLGKAHAWSKDIMAPTINWDPSYDTWRAIIESCLLFADPGQKLKPPNAPPETPTIPAGPDEGVTGYECAFTTSANEPEGEEVFFLFDWGNGAQNGWFGPYAPGETCEATYTWNDPGDYNVTVKARDINGGESKWSDPHVITILQAPIIDIRPVESGILNLDILIRNNGAVDAANVEWKLTFDGGFVLIGQEQTGAIPTIAPGDIVTVKSKPIIGLGQGTINVEASVPESSDTRFHTAKLFLFYIHVVPGGG